MKTAIGALIELFLSWIVQSIGGRNGWIGLEVSGQILTGPRLSTYLFSVFPGDDAPARSYGDRFNSGEWRGRAQREVPGLQAGDESVALSDYFRFCALAIYLISDLFYSKI